MNKEKPTPPTSTKLTPEDTIDSQKWLQDFRKNHPLQSFVYELELGNGILKALNNIRSK